MNRLAQARSLYLRQHAGNPVAWREWGPAALADARRLDRPILVSIGYSACHWCHVMAHESFENPSIAERMNRLFVPVKVDREERPDVDALYMEAVQAMTGHGGWPLTVFLTPDGEPFYGGTYYPPEPRGGMPGFGEVLEAVAHAWGTRRETVNDQARRLTEALRSQPGLMGSEAPDGELVAAAAAKVARTEDRAHGGFDGAPKFPQAPLLRFLARRAVRQRSEPLAATVARALAAMAGGGIHDQLAGGFHRYAVDGTWTVPHFEKMLADNAQLAGLYLDAWRLTGHPRFRQVTESTLRFMLHDLTGEHGAFHASLDADAAGVEGTTYVWTPGEVAEAAGADAGAALDWFGVTPVGNFEDGRTVLTARQRPEAVAHRLGLTPEALAAALGRARSAMLDARRRRPQPAVDRKIVAAWNGMAIDACAQAGMALGRPEYVAAAIRAAGFVRATLGPPEALGHMWDEGLADVPAFAEDYAGLVDAALSLYEATGDVAWLEWARGLARRLVADFHDPSGPGFFRTSAAHSGLPVRQKELVDGAQPGGNAWAAAVLLRLGAIEGDGGMTRMAVEALGLQVDLARRAPAAVGAALAALDDAVAGYREVAIVGPTGDAAAAALAAAVRAHSLPGTVTAMGAEGQAGVPMLAGKAMVRGLSAAYVCRGHVCLAPVTSPADLVAELDPWRLDELPEGLTVAVDPAPAAP